MLPEFRLELLLDNFARFRADFVVLEHIQEVLESDQVHLVCSRLVIRLVRQGKEQPLSEFCVCGQPEPDQLLCEFLGSQVPLLLGVPCLEDLSRKLLVLQLVQHAHTGVLPGPDPVLCPLLYQKLLFVDIPEHFHAVLPVYLPQHCYQLVLLHRFALLVLDRKLLTDLVAFMLELFLLLVHFVE